MDSNSISRLPHESNREFVYRYLKTNMMNFTLVPGTAMSEQDIANTLAVSRTPVREAFLQLSQEDLLEIVPQKGTYVSLIDLGSVAESKFLRETMEAAVMKLACQQFPGEALAELEANIAMQEACLTEKNYVRFFGLDEALHRLIFSGCNKVRIWNMMQQMHAHYNRVRRLNIAGGYDAWTTMEQHKTMVRAIREKDVILGVSTMTLHLNKVNIDINDLLHDYRQYFRQTSQTSLEIR